MNTRAALDNDLLFLIHDVAQLMRRHADRRARTRGMTRAQWAVLVRLDRQPGINQNDLAQLTDVEPITVGRLIDRLEQAGFVERKPDPKDRRIWRLFLTPAARPVLGEITEFRRVLNRELSDGIEPAALATALSALKTMRCNLSQTKSAAKKDGVR
jgi:MarR family transcriptional regulator, transcriptional regulator for hemolysin